MLSVLSGLVVGGAGGATLWFLKPRNGVIHPLLGRPWVEAPIAIGVAAAIAFGIALLVSGIYALF